MDIKQIDLWGNEVEVVEEEKRGRKKFKTMQEKHGEFKGFTCGECGHFCRYEYNRKTYFKCELWYVSNSSATDIRKSSVACRKFITKKEV